MKKAAAFAALAALLAGCIGPGPRNGPYAPTTGSTYERQIIGALGETEVSAAQRQAVLEAYDQLAPKLKRNDAEDLRVQRRWEALDPAASDYLTQVEAVAQQAAVLASDRLRAMAQFNQMIAATLDAQQLSRWSTVMNDQRAAFENALRLDPTFRRDEQR